MQSTVSQAPCGVKVEGVPWSWGFAAALQGESLYKGYYHFVSWSFLEWERGYNEGKALAARIHERVMAEVQASMPGAPADLVAGAADVALGASYCTHIPVTQWCLRQGRNFDFNRNA